MSYYERMAAAHQLAANAYAALAVDPGNAILAAQADMALAEIARLHAALRTPAEVAG